MRPVARRESTPYRRNWICGLASRSHHGRSGLRSLGPGAPFELNLADRASPPSATPFAGRSRADRRAAAQLEQARPGLAILAGWAGIPGDLNARNHLDYVTWNIALIKLLAEVGCQRLIGLGTCLEYDPAEGCLSEESATRPPNLYGASKLAVQTLAPHIARPYGATVAWTRLFSLYGPGEDPRRLVPSIICALLRESEALTTAGRQIRDYLHVEDAASAIWAIARSDFTGPVNVASGEPIAVRQVASALGDLLGRPELLRIGVLRDRADEPPVVYGDNCRLVRATGWERRFGLEDGLRQTIAWWRHRELNTAPDVISDSSSAVTLPPIV
jgi:nucleoside-diphosphate-sugar epimerase